MNIRNLGLVAPAVAALAFALPSSAATNMFATEADATAACGADEVVWVDLDRGRYYHKSQANYGKGGNGGYTCSKNAHSQYRESHD